MLPSQPPTLAVSIVPRRLRPLAAVLLLALVAGLYVACGSDDGGSGGASNPDKILSDTFGGSHSVKSGNLAVDLRLTATGLKALEKPVRLKLTGPFQSVGKGQLPKFAFELAVDGGGQTFTAGATSTGDKGYLEFEGTSYLVPDNIFASFKQGFQQAQTDSSDSKDSPTLAALGVHPRAWLKDARTVGEEDVEGTKTRHVAATIDVAKFLDDLDGLLGKAGSLGAGAGASVPSGISAETKRTIVEAVTKASFDVWSGAKDGTLRRLAIDIVFDVREAAREKVGGLESGKLTLDVTIADLNKSQDISAPPNPEPFTELTKKLQAAGTTTDSGSSGSSVSPAEVTNYAQCIQAAGNDVVKLRSCTELLGK